MAYQQKEGQGSLFRNDKQNERQPDFKGSILIKGVTYNISAWNRTSQNGREYMSLQAEERSQDYQQQGGYSAQQPRPSYQQAPSYQAPVSNYPGPVSPAQPSGYQSTAAPGYQAPAPTADDMPAFESDGEDLPF